jgi:DNA-binding NarL/FixJ family response regulator
MPIQHAAAAARYALGHSNISWQTGEHRQVWRVLVVEDDPQMREFFSMCVQRSDALALVAAVGSVAQARTWLADPGQRVDVLLTDLGLPDGSGLDVIRYARAHQAGCEALVISMFGDEDNVLASIEAGALGYIHKDAAPGDIANTILEMKAGASPISPMVARRVLAKYLALQSNQPLPHDFVARTAMKNIATSEERSLLSTREREVLELIARGFSYAEIARLQALSVHTVQSHNKSLYGKLAVHSRSEAVFEATRMGLLQSHGA